LKRIILIAGLLLLWLSSTSFSQNEKKAQTGIGINFYSGNQNMLVIPEGLSSIYLPIMFNGNYRLEPEIGFSSRSNESDYGSKTSHTLLRLGLGQFYISDWKKQVRFFTGLRFGMIKEWVDYSSSYDNNDDDANHVFISLCTGAEYQLAEHFTIGGEVQLGYIDYGKYDSDDPDESLIYHNALLTLRWYYK
jgi:hypothetical protein